ncbi:MAG: mercuric reductase [Deltaproteobacteria bacterium]|nr:mercuric reductase [Deltaproteobacteria bacterium]
MSRPPLLPADPHDAARLAALAPPDWRNPEPARRYDLVVLGAGTAGLVSAAIASGLGARVALVERGLLGGDCLNVGCVPSKAVLRAGRFAADARRARAIGLAPPEGAQPDFAAAMERMRAIRAAIAPHDSAYRFRDELGVDVFLGEGRFAGSGEALVGGRRLAFRRAIVATGARAALPPIPGLPEAHPLTNETVFDLREAPARLAVLGGGPIGCELAQAFARLGVSVTLFEVAPRLLARDDPEAAGIVAQALARDGVRVLLGTRVERVARDGAVRRLRFAAEGAGAGEEAFDELLVAAGRLPNVQGLGLEAAGVGYDAQRGVTVDDFLRTTNRRVYAVGDCALETRFTHAADAAARLAVRNALFYGRQRLSRLVIPWCTYTDPELAQAGLTPQQAEEQGVAIDTYTVPMTANDRARTEGETEGFARLHTPRGRDTIVGATIVGAGAGEQIALVVAAMTAGLGLGALSATVLPYPTRAMAVTGAANAYLRTRLTPLARRMLGVVLRLPH